MLERGINLARVNPKNQDPEKLRILWEIETAIRKAGIADTEEQQVAEQHIFEDDPRFTFNSDTGEVKMSNGTTFRFTPTENKVFTILVRNRGRLVLKEDILERVWGENGDEDLLKKYLQRVRKKLEPQKNAKDSTFISSIHGRGYRMVRNNSGAQPIPPNI